MDKNNTRNYGIDFLRIISMLAICIYHLIVHGNVISPAFSDLQNNALTFLKYATLWHVNCFALTSGYVYATKEFKFNRIFKIWGLTFFYSTALTGALKIFYPDVISWKALVVSFFPLTTSQYWYVTAYAEMFLLIPVFNIALQKIKLKDISILLQLFAFLFCVVCLIPILGRNFNMTVVKSGYSAVWLSYLYCVGGYWKLYGLSALFKNGYFERIKIPDTAFLIAKSPKIQFFLLFLLIIIASFLDIIFNSFSLSVRLTSYTSPNLFICALLVMNICISHSFSKLENYISFFAPLAFSVYLIHDNNWIRALFIQKFFMIVDYFPPSLCVPTVLVSGIILFSVCSGIEFIRSKTFSYLKRHISIFSTDEKKSP